MVAIPFLSLPFHRLEVISPYRLVLPSTRGLIDGEASLSITLSGSGWMLDSMSTIGSVPVAHSLTLKYNNIQMRI